MPRLFIAIDLPETQRQNLKEVCSGLPMGTPWTHPGQLHLTLRFIGEVDATLFQRIRETLAHIHFSPFPLQIKGLGTFPVKRHPSILWAGVVENQNLTRLQELIERHLGQLVIVRDNRRFHPHLTLARLSPEISPETLAAYLALNGQLSLNSFPVDCFHLYSSLLTINGAVHHLEESFFGAG